MPEKKITIIVPTRERADTLFYCLKTLVAQNYDNLKIIVSDNCSADNTYDVVSSFKDSRIKYIKTNNRTDMSSNWEFAAAHVDDGYIGFLGDDDGYLPSAFNIVNEVFNETGKNAIAWKPGIYNWPGTENENSFILPLGRDFYCESSASVLKKFSRGNFDIKNLLSLYPNGLVQAKKLHELRSRFGNFFTKTSQPDIFSTIVLTSEINSFAYSNAPLSFIGISKKSNSGSSYESSTVIQQYRTEYLDYNFHPRLELLQYTPLAIAEGYFRALDALGTPITDKQAKVYLRPVLHGLMSFIPSLPSAQLQIQGFAAARKIAEKNGISQEFINIAQLSLESKNNTVKSIENTPKEEIVDRSTFGARWDELHLDATKFGVSNIFEACTLAGNILSFNDSTKLNFFKSSHARTALSLARLGRRFAEKLLKR